MIPIIDVQTMRECDAATIRGGVAGRELMARAGQGIFESYPWRGETAIVCGVGNNAGDGYVLATLLHAAGFSCTLFLQEECFSADGRYWFDQCRAVGVPFVLWHDGVELSHFDTVVDCIYGTGFHGSATGVAAQMIERINQSGKPVVSVDINSGLNGDSGAGALYVRSTLTVSIGSYKPGLFLGNAKDAVGARCNVDIGIATPPPHIFLAEAGDFKDVLRPRRQASHKGDYGYVTVLGGSVEYAGAAKLANMSASALRAGCGVAELAVPETITGAVAPYLLESTLLPIPADGTGHMRYEPSLLDAMLSRRAAIAVGMGWGRGNDHAAILTHLLQKGSVHLVIDADGLNTLAKMDLSLLKQSACDIVLTPHLKEFERLSGIPIATIVQDPIRHASAFAKEWGICLLLKGACTVVTDGDTVILVDRGCAGMATAGSGDVLSGILAGLLGSSPVNVSTVAGAAYLAGLAGELAQADLNPISMLASDTVAHIPAAVSSMI